MTTGVLLMTYGAATTPDDVPAYLDSVYGGEAPEEVVTEFRRRARLVGGSPLVEITRAQAEALEEELNAGSPDAGSADGGGYRVRAGMRHTPPFVVDGLAELVGAGCDRVVAIVMSPQYSPIIMGGYRDAVAEAREKVAPEVPVRVADAWHDLPAWLDALAQRVREALDALPPRERATVPVVLTAHSLPERVVQREPRYLDQLHETIRGVVDRVGLADDRWQFAYQSAGHSPEPWLTPDMKDLLPGIAAAGHRRVLMVPVQFLADHLETLYDIDVGAREEAEEAGLTFHRIEMPNTMPAFISALAEVVHREEAALDHTDARP